MHGFIRALFLTWYATGPLTMLFLLIYTRGKFFTWVREATKAEFYYTIRFSHELEQAELFMKKHRYFVGLTTVLKLSLATLAGFFFPGVLVFFRRYVDGSLEEVVKRLFNKNYERCKQSCKQKQEGS